MIVLGMVLGLALYVGLAGLVAWTLSRQFRSHKARTTAAISFLVVFALIPVLDIVPGRLYFNHL